HLRVHRSWTDANRRDAFYTTLYGDRLGQSDDTVLRDVVGGQPREFFRRVDARKGCQIYDPATAGAAHRPEGGAAAEEGAGEIDPKRFLPGLRGGRVDGRLVQNGRGTDQCGRRTHAGGDGKEALDLAAVADVHSRDRCRAAVLVDRLADGLQLRLGARRQDDVGTGAGE